MRPFRTCRTLTPPLPGQVEDGPPVTVLHPIGCSETKPAVIPASNDQVTNVGPVAVCQLGLRLSHMWGATPSGRGA